MFSLPCALYWPLVLISSPRGAQCSCPGLCAIPSQTLDDSSCQTWVTWAFSLLEQKPGQSTLSLLCLTLLPSLVSVSRRYCCIQGWNHRHRTENDSNGDPRYPGEAGTSMEQLSDWDSTWFGPRAHLLLNNALNSLRPSRACTMHTHPLWTLCLEALAS